MEKKRPSPNQHASETAAGVILKGNNGAPWVCKEWPGGVKRWVQIPTGKGRAYLTHSNGGSPYKVVVDGNAVTAYALDDELWTPVWDLHRRSPRAERDKKLAMIYLKKVWRAPRAVKVFVGEYQGKAYRFDPSQKGNTVLVALPGNHCVFIGDRIFRFKPPEPIVAYRSPVGNSDVPYPWAVGQKNTYLLGENVFLPNGRIPTTDDPYGHYYSGINDAERKKIERTCRLPGYKEIHRPRA